MEFSEAVESDVIFVGPEARRSATSETPTKCVARR